MLLYQYRSVLKQQNHYFRIDRSHSSGLCPGLRQEGGLPPRGAAQPHQEGWRGCCQPRLHHPARGSLRALPRGVHSSEVSAEGRGVGQGLGDHIPGEPQSTEPPEATRGYRPREGSGLQMWNLRPVFRANHISSAHEKVRHACHCGGSTGAGNRGYKRLELLTKIILLF